MVDLLRTFDFGWVVWKVLVYGESEVKGTSFVHPLVRFDSERKVEDIIRVREVRSHGGAKREFGDIYRKNQSVLGFIITTKEDSF